MNEDPKACILTGYAPGTAHGITGLNSSPYPAGQQRLLRSLVYHGARMEPLAFQDFPNKDFDTSIGYNIKASCFSEAIRRGYNRILWLDSSVWAIRHVQPVFDYIEERGWYFYSNGFDLGQTMNDPGLEYFGFTREEAFLIPDLYSSMMGFHMGNPKAQEFMKRFLQAASDGLFNTSRDWQPASKGGSDHPRFLFDRQDQSVASAIRHQLEMEMVERNVFSAIAKNHDYSVPVEIIQRIIGKVESSQATQEEKNVLISELAGIEGYKESVVFVMRGL